MCRPSVSLTCTIVEKSGDIFFFQAEDGIRDADVTGVQTCALPIYLGKRRILVGVALVELRRLQPARDAVEPRGDRGGEGEIGVGVGARDPVLDAEPPALAAQPEAARPVVPDRKSVG